MLRLDTTKEPDLVRVTARSWGDGILSLVIGSIPFCAAWLPNVEFSYPNLTVEILAKAICGFLLALGLALILYRKSVWLDRRPKLAREIADFLAIPFRDHTARSARMTQYLHINRLIEAMF